MVMNTAKKVLLALALIFTLVFALTACGGDTAYTPGLQFTEQSNGTYSVSAYTGSATEVVIPSVYNGCAVTRIGSKTFYNCSDLTSITIPDSVTSIDVYVFYGCRKLTDITIGENSELTSIGDYAFQQCSNLTSITFGENSQLTTIGDFAFHNCSNLTSITIPSSVTSIDKYAFADCDSLTSITFGGTKAQWERVSKGSDWAFNTPTIIVTCTDGTVTETYSE